VIHSRRGNPARDLSRSRQQVFQRSSALSSWSAARAAGQAEVTGQFKRGAVSGGNVLLINAKAMVNNGTIRANGGAGAARGFGTNPGGGQAIVNTGSAITGSGSITATGGAGGAGTGTGAAGTSGAAGTVFQTVWS
jgi:hypothetical protein